MANDGKKAATVPVWLVLAVALGGACLFLSISVSYKICPGDKTLSVSNLAPHRRSPCYRQTSRAPRAPPSDPEPL